MPFFALFNQQLFGPYQKHHKQSQLPRGLQGPQLPPMDQSHENKNIHSWTAKMPESKGVHHHQVGRIPPRETVTEQ